MTLEDIQSRLEISEVLYRYCRGMDRMDWDLTLSCWHAGGTDRHAPLYAGSAEGFLTWLWPVHADMIATRHVLSNIWIQLAGDRAVSESYWNVQLRMERDGKPVDLLGAGRYVDQFERLDGVWAIRHRESIGDMTHVAQVLAAEEFEPPLIQPNNPDAQVHPAKRDKSDYSYSALDWLKG